MSIFRRVYNLLTGTPVANGKVIQEHLLMSNGSHNKTEQGIEAEPSFQEFTMENGQNGHSNGVEQNGMNGHTNGTNGVAPAGRQKGGQRKKRTATAKTPKKESNGIPMIAKQNGANGAVTPRVGFNRSRGMIMKNITNSKKTVKKNGQKNGKTKAKQTKAKTIKNGAH
ncbi:hypothetical protein WR25_06810 isoform A [Diploscapter pachys]|uniref:Uncharacterized protein n=1 Tax=Diploscapter pachys TaxID=2018661 RepID=A0A2A2LNH5_9BILA|nr:hypothetical protein WR25_06810 isoform A [Diploscapter pachys]